MIDGADIREVDLASLRSEIAFVADDSFLFSDTVAANIAYAHPEATREQVERAARRAQAHGFITELPDGYETVVGERGLTLSGGQRQRVAIARALLAEPRILILDDATSSVDARTETEIKRGLREAMEGRTTFIVAHRLSTISLADEIVVLDHGADRRSRDARRAARALLALQRDRREGARGLGLPPARPRGARGAGAAVNPDEQGPGRFRSIWLLLVDLWRLVRGEDGRGRKVRWLLGLLRPYRKQVALMFVALIAATAAALAPPYLIGKATDGILERRPRDARPGRRRVHRRLALQLGRRATCRPISSDGSASARSRTCGCGSSPTCRGCRSGSSRATGRGC